MLNHMLRTSRPPIEIVNTFTGTSLSSGVTSVTFSGHQVGDMLLAFGGSQGGTEPTITSGWTKILSATGGSNIRIIQTAYKFATSTADDTLTYTGTGTSSAAYLSGLIVRNATAIGATAANTTGGAVTSVSVPALTCEDTSGKSAIIGGFYLWGVSSINGTPAYTLFQSFGGYLLKQTSVTARTATMNQSVSNLYIVLEVKN